MPDRSVLYVLEALNTVEAADGGVHGYTISLLHSSHTYSPPKAVQLCSTNSTYTTNTCCVLQFCEVIKGYPLVPTPEIFGLHDNADITCQQAETYELLGTLLGLQPRSSGGSGGAGKSQEEIVGRLAQDILAKVGAE